jgi:hypothetical protein
MHGLLQNRRLSGWLRKYVRRLGRINGSGKYSFEKNQHGKHPAARLPREPRPAVVTCRQNEGGRIRPGWDKRTMPRPALRCAAGRDSVRSAPRAAVREYRVWPPP